MNSHESRESRFGADECDGDRPADLARRHPSSAQAPPPGDGVVPGEPSVPNLDDAPAGNGPSGNRPASEVLDADPAQVGLSAGGLPAGDLRPVGVVGDGVPAAGAARADDDAELRAAFAEVDIPWPTEEEAAAEAAERASRWDADDPRRRHDHFAPPTEPCECHCLHCGRTFSSEGIWFQRVVNDPQGFEGFWMCPTANCSGAGFTFDLFPTDPSHPANEGWHYDDDDDEEEEPEGFDGDDADAALAAEEADEDGHPLGDGPFGESPFGGGPAGDGGADADEYDPDEPRYKELDALYGDEDDDDLEGEEWKYGLQPGERPPNPAADEARREWELEQRMYDEPDQRPRSLDWSDRDDRREDRRPGSFGDGPPGDGQFKDDDIPF